MKCRERYLFFGERYFVHKLLIVNRFNLHIHPIGLRIGLVLADAESLPALGSALVDDGEFHRRMLLKEVAKYKFSLGLAIGLRAIIERYVHRLVEITR